MKIRLKLLGVLGIISDCRDEGETEVDFIGNTVGDVVNHLRMKLEEKRLFLNEQGEIQAELLVLLNRRRIFASDQFRQPLAEDDLVELALTPE